MAHHRTCRLAFVALSSSLATRPSLIGNKAHAVRETEHEYKLYNELDKSGSMDTGREKAGVESELGVQLSEDTQFEAPRSRPSWLLPTPNDEPWLKTLSAVNALSANRGATRSLKLNDDDSSITTGDCVADPDRVVKFEDFFINFSLPAAEAGSRATVRCGPKRRHGSVKFECVHREWKYIQGTCVDPEETTACKLTEYTMTWTLQDSSITALVFTLPKTKQNGDSNVAIKLSCPQNSVNPGSELVITCKTDGNWDLPGFNTKPCMEPPADSQSNVTALPGERPCSETTYTVSYEPYGSWTHALPEAFHDAVEPRTCIFGTNEMDGQLIFKCVDGAWTWPGGEDGSMRECIPDGCGRTKYKLKLGGFGSHVYELPIGTEDQIHRAKCLFGNKKLNGKLKFTCKGNQWTISKRWSDRCHDGRCPAKQYAIEFFGDIGRQEFSLASTRREGEKEAHCGSGFSGSATFVCTRKKGRKGRWSYKRGSGNCTKI